MNTEKRAAQQRFKFPGWNRLGDMLSYLAPRQTRKYVLQPMLGDLCEEWAAAVLAGNERRMRLLRIRGYLTVLYGYSYSLLYLHGRGAAQNLAAMLGGLMVGWWLGGTVGAVVSALLGLGVSIYRNFQLKEDSEKRVAD